MILFPNLFSGKNITFEVLCTSDYWNFKPLLLDTYMDCRIINQVKRAKIIYVTFSRMKSNINEHDQISYHEVIFKVPVEINGEKYMYPVISYVDNEFSYIRGTFLGYYKRYINRSLIKMTQNKVKIENNNISLEYEFLSRSENTSKIPFEKPFVLNHATYIPGVINNIGLYTLISRGNKKIRSETIKKENLKVISSDFLHQKGEVQKGWLTEDKFILDGIKKIDDIVRSEK